MSRRLVIFGTRQIAEVIAYFFDHDSDYDVVAFTADRDYISDEKFNGRPVIPFEDLSTIYSPEDTALFVAVGYQKLNAIRREKMAAARRAGFELASYVSSKASTWQDLKLGANSVVMEANVIQPFVRIGAGVILWSGNHIGHHSVIGDYNFIASHVVVSGNVVIGESCFVGVNSTIRDGVRVGNRCIIGAGSLLLGDTKDDEVYSQKGTAASPVPSSRVRL
ncbi:MAG: acetyltransferase [Beijerinckiaceae bacterium]|nr:acetyltransferase [Beijerinckiaceae bacterium]